MGRNHGAARKEAKRTAAQERQAAYDKLTTEQKIQQLDRSGLTAKSQRARLAGQAEAEVNQQEKAHRKQVSKEEITAIKEAVGKYRKGKK